MEGICPCGGHIREKNHTVTTLRGAENWMNNPKPNDLPLRVKQSTCSACGRQDTEVKCDSS